MVHFVPVLSQHQLAKRFSESDAFVFASQFENYGMVLGLFVCCRLFFALFLWFTVF